MVGGVYLDRHDRQWRIKAKHDGWTYPFDAECISHRWVAEASYLENGSYSRSTPTEWDLVRERP